MDSTRGIEAFKTESHTHWCKVLDH